MYVTQYFLTLGGSYHLTIKWRRNSVAWSNAVCEMYCGDISTTGWFGVRGGRAG